MEAPSGQHSIGSSYRDRRHEPEHTALYPIVERHLSTLRDELQHHAVPDADGERDADAHVCAALSLRLEA